MSINLEERTMRLNVINGADLAMAALVLAGLLCLGACAVGPKYTKAPELDLGSGWIEAEGELVADADLADWWSAYGDPTLTALIDQAQSHNLDVRLALERIEEARIALNAADAAKLPTSNLRGSVIGQRQSENGALPVGRIPGLDRDRVLHDGGLDVSWELDLFGRIRKGQEVAQANVSASEADLCAIRLSIAAQVARTYFSLRGAQAERRAHDTMLADLEQKHALIALRVKLGDLPTIELERLQTQLNGARATVPTLEGRIRGAALALGTLTGGRPEDYLSLQSQGPEEWQLPQIPQGERADLLRRRPDIAASERRLAASTARIGMAMAEQFPKLGISASGGFQALDAGKIFNASSQTLALGPLISWRIFDGGRIKAEIHTAESRSRQAALAYEQTVLTALGEAEQALSAYRSSQTALDRQGDVLASNQRVLELAQQRFAAGESARTEVLDAQRQLHETQETMAHLSAQAAQASVAAFHAMGGGWR